MEHQCCWIWPVASGVVGLIIGLILGRLGKGKTSSEEGATPDGNCVEIYVGNLSYDMTEDQMRREFEKYGSVLSARIISNRFNHKSKGFGFVEMPNRPEAEAAIEALNDKELLGRKLRVNEAKNKSRE